MAVYVDSSAVVKLIREEPETAALLEYLRGRPDQVSSVIAAIELARAVARAGEGADRLGDVFDRLILVDLDEGIVRRASTMEPSTLRTLDSIHLATAIEIGREIEAILTYDDRMADAARSIGLEVASPGRGD